MPSMVDFKPDRSGHGYDMRQFLPYAERPDMSRVRTFRPVLEQIPVRSLRASQSYVHPDFMNVKDEPIEVFRDLAGVHHVLDGNHRSAKAVVRNASHINGWVFQERPDEAKSDIQEMLRESLAASNDSLYHATSFMNAAKIIQDQQILAKTHHLTMAPIKRDRENYYSVTDYNGDSGIRRYDSEGEGRVAGVSLTRSFPFAKRWNSVIFELSKNTLKANKPLRPVNYWSTHDGLPLNHPEHTKSEAEEFAVGPIDKLERHLKAIHISKATADRLLNVEDSNIMHVLTHPKTKFY